MLTYDITFQKFRLENGLYAKDHKPRLVYGTRPVIDIQLQSNGRAFDAAGVSAWTCAVAQDHLVSTVPIARTTSGITKTENSAGAVLHIPIDLLTNQAKTYLDGSKEKECYFGISGLDSNGRLVCYVEFVVTLEFQVDPEGTGTVQPVTVTSLTQAQVEAMLAGKQNTLIEGPGITIIGNTISADSATSMQSDWAENNPNAVSYIWNKPNLAVYATVASLEEHTENTGIHVTAADKDAWNAKITSPAAPVTGQYLRKTASGWDTSEVTAPSWGSIGGALSSQTDLQEALDAKQGTLTAGGGVTIAGSTISSDVQDVQVDGQSVVSGGTASISTSALVHKFTGSGAPTTATVGAVGDLYTDTATRYAYECVAVSGGTYTWRKLGAEYLPLSGGTLSGNIKLSYGKGIVLDIGGVGNGGGITSRGTNTNWYGISCFQCKAHAYAIAWGLAVEANSSSAAFGKYSTTYVAYIEDNIALKVGGGSSDSSRKNILELDWQGDLLIERGYRNKVTSIPSATSAHTLTEGVSTHVPSAASTYTLPNVTDSTVTHEIVLYIDLTTTASFTFQTAGGTGIVPKMGFTPAVGDKVTALCRWEFGAWQVYLVRTEEAGA